MPSYDVLIIGAGLAGQRAALAAAEKGVSVANVDGYREAMISVVNRIQAMGMNAYVRSDHRRMA